MVAQEKLSMIEPTLHLAKSSAIVAILVQKNEAKKVVPKLPPCQTAQSHFRSVAEGCTSSCTGHTIAMLTMHAETWGDQIRAYEREKRYVVDAGFVSGQPLRLQPGMFQAQERSKLRIVQWCGPVI